MGKRTRKPQKTRTPKHASGLNQELVVAATAETMEEAKEYEISLKNNDIPAMVKRREDEFAGGNHFAVMVPEDMADEANVVIESQGTYDDLYDFATDDDNEEDFGDDIFEEGS
jgi:cytochrome c1